MYFKNRINKYTLDRMIKNGVIYIDRQKKQQTLKIESWITYWIEFNQSSSNIILIENFIDQNFLNKKVGNLMLNF